MKTISFSFLLFVMIAAHAVAQSVDPAIVAANKTFMQAFGQGATTMGSLYATDAQLFPPGGAAISSSTAIGPFWKMVFDSGVKKAMLETIATEKAGDRIIETGQYTLTGGDGATLDTGKYMVVWKKEGSNWKLYRDIWNTSQAAK